MTDPLLQVLEETARARLAGLEPTRDPVGRTASAVARSAAQRRNGAVVATVLSAVVVLSLVMTVVPRLTSDRRPPAGPDQWFPDVVRTVQLAGHTWPVAGQLAADPDFVAAAEAEVGQVARSRTDDCRGEGRPRVLFADDLEGLRLVVTRNDYGCWWFGYGPAGATATQLTVREPAGFRPTTQAGFALALAGVEGAEVLVVIAPVPAHAELATLPAMWPSLAPHYAPLALREGVTVMSLDAAGAPTNPAWLSVRTTIGDGMAVQAVMPDVVRLRTPATVSAGDRLTFLQGLPDRLINNAQYAVDFAVRNGRFRDDRPVTLTILASGDQDVVVEAVQDGLRSRVFTSGRLRTRNQVLVSDAAGPDPRPVLGWGSWPNACAAWLPVGRELNYTSKSSGHATARADRDGFVRGLPCEEGLTLDTVSDGEGTVLWIADPADSGVQP